MCNLTTYPHLMGFFRELGVDTEESDMSFALSTPEVEWGSRGLSAIFAQPGLWRSPKFLLMIWEVIAFGRQAPEVLSGDAKWEGVSLGEYLKLRRYSAFFCTHYVTPMCAAIWSCSDADALAFATSISLALCDLKNLAPADWAAALQPCFDAALPKADTGKLIGSLLEQCAKDVQIEEAKE